jgi:hypothetical protein
MKEHIYLQMAYFLGTLTSSTTLHISEANNRCVSSDISSDTDNHSFDIVEREDISRSNTIIIDNSTNVEVRLSDLMDRQTFFLCFKIFLSEKGINTPYYIKLHGPRNLRSIS